MLVDTGGRIGAPAVTDGDLPPFEVAEELGPFLVAGGAVFLAGPLRPTTGDERPVPVDDLLRVDGLWWSQVLELFECLSFPGLSEGREVRPPGRCAAAVVGGVVGPVTAAGSLPGHGDTDVDAEESGEHGGGQFGGQAEKRCRSILSGPEPELA